MAKTPVSNGHDIGINSGAGSAAARVKSYARIPEVLDVPHLILSQVQSFDWFKTDGLAEVFKEFSPITDYTGKKYELHFLEHTFEEPKLFAYRVQGTEKDVLPAPYVQALSSRWRQMRGWSRTFSWAKSR